MSAVFDRAGADRTTAVAAAVAFAELAGSAVGTMLTGGGYSLLRTAGALLSTPFVTGFGALAVAAVATAAITRRSRPALGPAGPTAPDAGDRDADRH